MRHAIHSIVAFVRFRCYSKYKTVSDETGICPNAKNIRWFHSWFSILQATKRETLIWCIDPCTQMGL